MNQKDEEKLIIQYFRKHCPGFPKGRLIPSESPDFILKVSPKRSIGIELTRPGPGNKVTGETIRQAVGRKNEKWHLYRKGWFSELWLIIHVDSVPPGDPVWDLPVGESTGHTTVFSRVFLFSLFEGKVRELPWRP